MSDFDHVAYEFDILHIEQLEPFQEVHDLVATMVSGLSGQSPVTLKQQQKDQGIKEQVGSKFWISCTEGGIVKI